MRMGEEEHPLPFQAPRTYTEEANNKHVFLSEVVDYCNQCLEGEACVPDIKEAEVKTAVTYMTAWMKNIKTAFETQSWAKTA